MGGTLHGGNNDDWPTMSSPKYVLKEFVVCYQNFTEYVGLLNIKQQFHSGSAFNKSDKIL